MNSRGSFVTAQVEDLDSKLGLLFRKTEERVNGLEVMSAYSIECGMMEA